MIGESHKVFRIYGRCNLFCIPYSQLSSVRSLATHRVFFEFKHWVIYVQVFCFVHRVFEIWCIEKIFHKWADLKDDLVQDKVVRNGSVWASCSFYSDVIFMEKFKYVSKFMFLDKIMAYLMNLNSDYNPLIDNCEHFKRKFWSWLDTVT